MKFLVLFVATVALASASYIGTKNVDIKQDGTIVIRGENGKQIEIFKQYGPYGQKNIEIEVTGPNTVTKKIQINDYNQINVESGVEYEFPENYEEYRGKRSSYYGQTDVLDEILNQYHGTVDQKSYEQLLNQVQKAVSKGKLSADVLDIFQGLYENQYAHGQDYYQYAPYNKAFYGEQTKYGQMLSKFFKQPYGFYGQGFYGQQFEQKFFYTILVKLFDSQVFFNYFNQEQAYYGQHNVFYTLINQGAFDRAALVELINNPVLRTVLVQQGVFHESVLEQLLYTFKSQGVYSQALLEQLVNKQYLQYFFAKYQSYYNKYTVEQIFNQKVSSYNYYSVIYGEEFLTYLVYNPIYRNFLVQHGIFNQSVLKQFYYVLYTQGVFSQTLYQQLVNKQYLKNALVQYGVEGTALEQLVNNEVLGLVYLFNTEFYQQTFKSYQYQQHFGAPEYVYQNYQNYQTYPYGDDVVGIDIKKTIVKPATGLYDTNKFDYFKNMIYGQQGFYNKYYQGYPYTFQGKQGFYNKYYQGYPFTFQGKQGFYNYNQYPAVEQQVY